MEVKGDEFLKNLEIEKEKAELEKRKSELNSQKIQSTYQQQNSPLGSVPFDMDTNFQELDDIRLNKNSNNKQKYILFGFTLILLFLITILIIKLISEPQTSNNFTDEKIIEEETQEIITQDATKSFIDKNVNNSLDINKIIQAEDNSQLQQENKPENTNKATKESDIFGIEQVSPTKLDTNIEISKQKVLQESPIKEITFQETKVDDQIKKSTTKQKINKGYYMQVGAFTKYPDKKLLNKLKINGYTVIIHKMEVKGKLYNKVLIGPYKSKSEANINLPYVKETINKNTYIIRF